MDLRRPLHLFSLSCVLLALPGTGAGQALILEPDPREAAERRAELDTLRRIADVFQAVRNDYVDVLPEAPLAARCVAGMEAWLAARSMNLAPAPAASSQLAPAARVADFLQRAGRQFVGVDHEKLGDACIKPMVENLDKLTSYLDREAFRELQVGTRGEFGAIGVEIGREGDYTVIVSSIDGTPAARSDLKQGDLILSIDGKPAKGLPLQEVAQMLRGKVGSAMVLELRRAGGAEPLRREFKREVIRLQTVRPTLLEGRVLHVRLTQFAEATYESFLAALRAESAKVPEGLAGLILDLRNNSGGLLNSCVAIAAQFLPQTAMVVEMRGRNEHNNRKMYARPADYQSGLGNRAALAEPLRSLPMVVIVNRRSAACSEILAAALQDHKRARLLGEKTFGIGTIQTILPLGGSSALKLTTARYYRAGGVAFEANPVTPDVFFDFGEAAVPAIPFGAPGDPALAPARKLLFGN